MYSERIFFTIVKLTVKLEEFVLAFGGRMGTLIAHHPRDNISCILILTELR
jgi:hypothetical protein